ncbi:2-isopropylmalate synthase [Marinobacter salinisoli]|uniref:2-isopropylmalate synthase n=1 Tax=Marinobacter salinisoli TaxID=2769486 RepID=A0ABX7MUT1_9GAMM|nr:2-isopropylmalate synthase [Marinobacter salinisoli]QSP96145.1 2-isopropylmalate synthase [Marinobacter salinisoli]
MIQTENERQYYLGMAGVRLWYAREPLPGAAPSPEFVFDEPESEGEMDAEALVAPQLSDRPMAQPSKPAHADRVQAKARVSNLQALVDGATAPATPATPAQEPPEPVSSPLPDADQSAAPSDAENTKTVSKPAAVKLALKLWMGQRFVLVSDLSSDASLKLQESLAENILRSVGEETLETVGPIGWPVFNNVRAPGNSMADLRSVLSHALSQVQGQKVIVLGTVPRDAEGDWLHDLAGRRSDVLFPMTLTELASDPNQKRALWQMLKPLVD